MEGVGLVAAVQLMSSDFAKKSGELKNWSRVTDVNTYTRSVSFEDGLTRDNIPTKRQTPGAQYVARAPHAHRVHLP